MKFKCEEATDIHEDPHAGCTSTGYKQSKLEALKELFRFG